MKTFYFLPHLFISLLLVLLSACSTSSVGTVNIDHQGSSNKINTTENQSVEADKTKEKIGKHMELTGTVVYQNLEGGFYGFVSDSGEKFLPIGLVQEYKQNGLALKLKVKKLDNTVSFHQFGDHIEVIDVEVLNDSNVVPIQKEL